jgi:hypothetical protein
MALGAFAPHLVHDEIFCVSIRRSAIDPPFSVGWKRFGPPLHPLPPRAPGTPARLETKTGKPLPYRVVLAQGAKF